LGEFSKISPSNEIIRLQENSPQTRFSNRIIFEIKLVETMKTVDMSVHIQRIN
jgi:hypothetical protein